LPDKKVSWIKKNSIGIITIDNPPANAISNQVIPELLNCFRDIEETKDVRAVILTGAGEKFFIAGADISEFPNLMQRSAGDISRIIRQGHQVINYIDFFSKPVIAAVEGIALGAGLEIVLACDLCIASENAQFGLPEVNLGLIPGDGGTQRLPRRIGAVRAKEMMFLGKQIKAEEALKIGLINHMVPQGKAFEEAKKIAIEVAGRPAVSVSFIKQSVNRGIDLSLLEGLKIEADLFEMVFRTEDVKEGVSAFMNKRAPKFKHR